MSRTLSQIELGSTVWVREGGEDIEYILIRKDQNGVELLRKRAYTQRRMNATNTSVYENSEGDAWLSNAETGFLSRFSQTLLSNLVNRSISTFTYGDTECHYISRRCYLPSYGDMFLETPTTLYSEVNIVTALMINNASLNANTARISRNNENAENVTYFLRSALSASSYYTIYINGSVNNTLATNVGIYMRPIINVSPSAIISDEGEPLIYLLPEEKPRVIEFKGRVGELSTRPKKVLVNVDNNNLTNIAIQVCNNYDDSAPTWENVTLGVEKTFENTAKTTENWVIGIHCYATTATLAGGYFKEPKITVEV